MGMCSEFKAFAMRGNVLDMAVGVVVGGAFGKIVSAFVDKVLMPPLGLMLGGMNLAELGVTLRPAELDAAGAVTKEAVVLGWGAMVQASVDFLLIAFAVFLLVKAINRMRAKEEAAPAAPAPPPADIALLTEIRDLLKSGAR